MKIVIFFNRRANIILNDHAFNVDFRIIFKEDWLIGQPRLCMTSLKIVFRSKCAFIESKRTFPYENLVKWTPKSVILYDFRGFHTGKSSEFLSVSLRMVTSQNILLFWLSEGYNPFALNQLQASSNRTWKMNFQGRPNYNSLRKPFDCFKQVI